MTKKRKAAKTFFEHFLSYHCVHFEGDPRITQLFEAVLVDGDKVEGRGDGEGETDVTVAVRPKLFLYSCYSGDEFGALPDEYMTRKILGTKIVYVYNWSYGEDEEYDVDLMDRMTTTEFKKKYPKFVSLAK